VLLQWGRSHAAAEIYLMVHDDAGCAASMGPQPCGCGNSASDNHWIIKELQASLRAGTQRGKTGSRQGA